MQSTTGKRKVARAPLGRVAGEVFVDLPAGLARGTVEVIDAHGKTVRTATGRVKILMFNGDNSLDTDAFYDLVSADALDFVKQTLEDERFIPEFINNVSKKYVFPLIHYCHSKEMLELLTNKNKSAISIMILSKGNHDLSFIEFAFRNLDLQICTFLIDNFLKRPLDSYKFSLVSSRVNILNLTVSNINKHPEVFIYMVNKLPALLETSDTTINNPINKLLYFAICVDEIEINFLSVLDCLLDKKFSKGGANGNIVHKFIYFINETYAGQDIELKPNDIRKIQAIAKTFCIKAEEKLLEFDDYGNSPLYLMTHTAIEYRKLLEDRGDEVPTYTDPLDIIARTVLERRPMTLINDDSVEFNEQKRIEVFKKFFNNPDARITNDFVMACTDRGFYDLTRSCLMHCSAEIKKGINNYLFEELVIGINEKDHEKVKKIHKTFPYLFNRKVNYHFNGREIVRNMKNQETLLDMISASKMGEFNYLFDKVAIANKELDASAEGGEAGAGRGAGDDHDADCHELGEVGPSLSKIPSERSTANEDSISDDEEDELNRKQPHIIRLSQPRPGAQLSAQSQHKL